MKPRKPTLESQLEWADRQAKHVLRRVPTCGLELEDVQSVAWLATSEALKKFRPARWNNIRTDADMQRAFQLYAVVYVQQMVFSRCRTELSRRMRHAAALPELQRPPEQPEHHAEIDPVDSPLAIALQWLPPVEHQDLRAWLAGRKVDDIAPVLERLRAELEEQGITSAGDLLEPLMRV